jgi:hypothetical protein
VPFDWPAEFGPRPKLDYQVRDSFLENAGGPTQAQIRRAFGSPSFLIEHVIDDILHRNRDVTSLVNLK